MRVDRRNTSALYYLKDNKIMKAMLNPKKTCNDGYANMTFKMYQDKYLAEKNRLKAVGRVENENIRTMRSRINKETVDAAKKDGYSDASNLRDKTEAERQLASMHGRLMPEDVLPDAVPIDAHHEEQAVPQIPDNTATEKQPKKKKNFNDFVDDW